MTARIRVSQKKKKKRGKVNALSTAPRHLIIRAYCISRTGLDWTGLVKRGLVKRGLVKRGLVRHGHRIGSCGRLFFRFFPRL